MQSMEEQNIPQEQLPVDEEEIAADVASKPGKKRKTGELIQQLGLNMLVLGLIALIALLVWQRFFVQPGAAATAPSSEPSVEEDSRGTSHI